MMNKNFAAFILTHGRPDNVRTYSTLRRAGYTGKIFLVVDDLDKTRDEYQKKYPGEVIIFDKEYAKNITDQGDNTDDLRSVVYARNVLFEIAKSHGIKNFIELDDDYNAFNYRFNDQLSYQHRKMRNMDTVLNACIEFVESTPTLSLAFLQGGDYIGGATNRQFSAFPKLVRKCMNSFICSTSKPFKFQCKMNDDVTTYTWLGSQGKLFFSTNQISLEQAQTQQNSGGMTDIYIAQGTYVKSFFSVMFSPSSVKVSYLPAMKRIHHIISWNNCAPKILQQKYKKES